MAVLRELAAGRADLLAEVPGILEGHAGGRARRADPRQAVRLCRDAAADPAVIPAWIEEGRRRKANASHSLFSAPRHTRPLGLG